jgi:hypothetical protein
VGGGIVIDQLGGLGALIHLHGNAIRKYTEGSPVGVLLEPDSRATARNEGKGSYQIVSSSLDMRVVGNLLV